MTYHRAQPCFVCSALMSSFPLTKKMTPIVCASPQRRPRKPKGYWSEIENIRNELKDLRRDLPSQIGDILPTARFLRDIGRRDIDNAITKMGGYHKVAEMLGYSTSSAKRPPGYWKDFENLKAEIDAFLREKHPEIPAGIMPTLKQLRDARRSDIVEGVEQHGGTVAVASKIGLKQLVAKKAKYYWKDWDKVESEIRAFVAQRAKAERKRAREESVRLNKKRALRMPSQRELRAAGRGDLAEAITDFHGGYRIVAKRLGFISGKKDDFFYDDFYNLARELYGFVKEVGLESVMPSTNLFKIEGRTDLAAAIVKFGGKSAVSQRLGLQYRVRTREAFKDWGVFRKNLLSFMEAHGKPGEIPSSRTLNNFGRVDLYQAVLHHGGSRSVADRMGLKRNYWQDFHSIGAQVLQFIAVHGTEGVMPTETEFSQVGRTALNVAVSKFGHSQVAKRLGLKEPPQSTRFAFDTLLNRSSDDSDDWDKTNNKVNSEGDPFDTLLNRSSDDLDDWNKTNNKVNSEGGP